MLRQQLFEHHHGLHYRGGLRLGQACCSWRPAPDVLLGPLECDVHLYEVVHDVRSTSRMAACAASCSHGDAVVVGSCLSGCGCVSRYAAGAGQQFVGAAAIRMLTAIRIIVVAAISTTSSSSIGGSGFVLWYDIPWCLLGAMAASNTRESPPRSDVTHTHTLAPRSETHGTAACPVQWC